MNNSSCVGRNVLWGGGVVAVVQSSRTGSRRCLGTYRALLRWCALRKGWCRYYARDGALRKEALWYSRNGRNLGKRGQPRPQHTRADREKAGGRK